MTDRQSRFVENGLDGAAGASPMEPPQAFHLAGAERLDHARLPEALAILVDDHKCFSKVLDDFEAALLQFKNSGWTLCEDVNRPLKAFFRFMDEDVVRHSAMEEKALFPVLHKKLIAAGECSPGEHPTTAVDVMEDDHAKVLQASCLVFNLIGIGNRLRDMASRETVFQIAFDQGREIVETMRLHIFKENEVLFMNAQKWFSEDDFRYVLEKMRRYIKPDSTHSC